MEIENLLKKIIPFFLFVIPLFFLTDTANFFEFNKMYLVFIGSVLILGAVLVRNILGKKAFYYTTTLDLAIFLFLLANLLSTFFASANRLLPFWGRTGMILSFTLLYFALLQAGNNSRRFLQSLFASSFVLSLITILAYTQVLAKFLPWDFTKSALFTPAGSLFSLIGFELVILPSVVFFALKSGQFFNKILYFLVGAVGLTATVLAVSQVLPGNKGQITFLPYQYGWWIAVDIFKVAKTAFLGVGPEGFLAAFSQFRPTSYNLTPIWTLRFTNSSNELLQILTTTGFLGLLAFLYLIVKSAKTLWQNLKKDEFNTGLKLSLAVNILLVVILPANFLTFFTLYVLTTLIAKQIYSKKEFNSTQILKIANGAAIGLMLVLVYFSGRVWLAEASFKKALDAANANQGLETYNNEMDAIRLNPFMEKYRVSFAQVNLALANSLVAGKKDLTDQDRQNITTLVSQSIAEAKAAAALDPANPIYWENLASIYQALINFANGADQWAIASYVQAIRLDPVNPTLRIQLGGLLYAMGKYDDAADQFKRALDLKPDLANAYYNLSWAYRQKKDIVASYNAMQQVIALVPQDSSDLAKASQELDQLRALLPPEAKTSTSSATTKESLLTPPPPLPTPPAAGPINLPKEVEPEVPPAASPTPRPS